ncbi:hypothetical protein IAU60_002906 [Kwoniella sp. DSM 27419]
MSYQPANQYSDNNYGNSYGNNGGGYGGGYSDEPSGGYGKSYGRGEESYPMSSGNPNAAYSSDGVNGYRPKKKRNKWLWIGLPILLLVIILAAVLGGVFGSRASNNDNKSSSGSTKQDSTNANTGVPSGVTNVNSAAASETGANGDRYLAIATDSYYLPVYATGTATAGYSEPTKLSDAKAEGKWPDDPSPPSNSSMRANPRLAPDYKWQALTGGLIANNPYFKQWNETIVNNASATLGDDPTPYTEDGGLTGSGVLDVAREVKLKVKNWAYAYRVTNETKYADRVWLELQTAAGNNSNVPFGADDGTRWNPQHFLDVAEFSAAFAIGYDWLYDFWTDEQRDAIMWSILNLGLRLGHDALSGASSASGYNWWAGSQTGNPMVDGNWNCVINGGLTQAAIAIMGRDPTGLAQQTLDLTVPDAYNNCFQGAFSDGTWAETPNYWYFGTTGAAEMVNALISAYGDDRGLSASNPGFNLTSVYHMYVQGMTSLFDYGDHGPNKYSATANSLILFANVFNTPRYALYQRDHHDAAEPWSMFWYDPATDGTWWDGLALDHHFDDPRGQWATARSSWSDNSGTYWAMKASELTGHQTHGDLDVGDFVLDAMGQRWAGELGSGQYLSTGYFSSEAQDSQRWLYYRKRTEGQNTLLINNENQNVGAQPTGNWGSSGTAQGPAPSLSLETSDTAYFWTDMTSAYNGTGGVKRGIRFINGRKQILLQDDVTSSPTLQWRMHTNATVSIDSSSSNTATLTLGDDTLIAKIVQGPSGAAFSTAQPVRESSDPAVPSGNDAENDDQPNPGVTVLTIDVNDGGSFSLQVLFTPQWGNGFTAVDSVNNVALDQWSTTSH